MTTNDYYTDKIEQVLIQVRQFFPSVTQVYYDSSAGWSFQTDNREYVDLVDTQIDYDLIEQSVDQAFADRGLPSTYTIHEF